MRNFFLILFVATLSLLSFKNSFAQVEKIKFDYDLCGNRTDKYLKIEVEKKSQAGEWSEELNDTIIKEELPVKVFPNPTQGIINIESSDFLSTGSFEILITTSTGDIKFSGIINEQKTTFDLKDFATGVYLVKLFSQQKSITYKIVKY